MKLNPPAGTASQVPRPRLLDWLGQAEAARLVLFRAPAGFGKTTAMREYRVHVQQQGVPTAWITLDRSDNDVSRLLHCLLKAMGPILAKSDRGRGSSGSALHFVTRLQQCNVPFVLFVDEYEVIRDEAVHSLFREMLECLPRHARLVIGTRSTPILGIARLRARGLLAEVDADLLRFSVEETGDYLTVRRGIKLSAEDVARLHRKTEGWIAGLWLASAALARIPQASDFVNRFSGSHLEVAEYLSEDVLNLQTVEMRRFLLHTSILRTFTPALCRALVPDVDTDALLRQLEAENVLVSRIGGDEEAFRYHSLFGSFLQAQLKREDPCAVGQLHRAASAWYLAHGRPVPAIDHSVEGADVDETIRLLDDHGMRLLHDGRMRLLTRWFDALPHGPLASRPRLQITRAWAICFTRGAGESLAYVQSSGLDASRDPAVRTHLTALQAVLLSMLDRIEEAYALGRSGLSTLPTSEAFADTALLAVQAGMCSAKGETDEAFRLMEMMRSNQRRNFGTINDMYCQSTEGVIALREGRLKEATARFRIAVGVNSPDNATFTHGNAWAGVLYAASVYEADDPEQAEALLRVYLPMARDVGLPDQVILSYRMLARIAHRRGDPDRAFRYLVELESIGNRRELSRVASSGGLERSRLHLMQGHVDAARDELHRIDQPAAWGGAGGMRLMANETDDPEVARLRLDAWVGEPTAAAEALDRAISTARHQRRLWRAMKLELFRAVALQRAGRIDSAVDAADAVLRTCWSEGFVRTVLDEGATMGALVRETVLRRHPDPRSPYAGWLQLLLESFGIGAAAEPPNRVERPGALEEPLTPQELKVLHLLADGHSNKRIADKLEISDSTVRTHLRAINHKLHVSSRLQAVAIGKAFGLLP